MAKWSQGSNFTAAPELPFLRSKFITGLKKTITKKPIGLNSYQKKKIGSEHKEP
jgi:hypothetical protein